MSSTMRDNNSNNVKPVTDSSLPTVFVSTSIPRELHNKLIIVAKRRQLTKSALMRKLIEILVDSES